MKKVILLISTAILLVVCVNSNTQNNNVDRYVYDDPYVSKEITRYGCEYWIYSNSHGGYPVHKGNCKYCAERRKKEMKELIEQLKKAE